MTPAFPQTFEDYYAALDRLKAGRPTFVPKGTRITKDAVSIEAGRGKGSIKKSRPVFADLILAIEDAAAEQSRPQNESRMKLTKAQGNAERYRAELEAALAREVALVKQVYDLKKMLASLTGTNIIPIRALDEA